MAPLIAPYSSAPQPAHMSRTSLVRRAWKQVKHATLERRDIPQQIKALQRKISQLAGLKNNIAAGEEDDITGMRMEIVAQLPDLQRRLGELRSDPVKSPV